MKKFLIFSLGLLLTFAISAQEVSQQYGRYVPVYSNSTYMTNLPKQKTAPKGSVYLEDEWLDATIVLKDSSYISGVEANYNFYSKYVEIKRSGTEKVSLLNFSKVDWLILSQANKNKVYENCTNFLINYPELGQCEFLEVLADGKPAKLIDKLTLDVIEANYNTALDAGQTSDTYIIEHTYFIINGDELIEIRKRRRFILNAFNDKRKQVKDYIKENNLKMRKIEHIAIVVKYYNSLHEEK